MSPSRRPDSGGSRSAEDRERDRRERERRRARRTGGATGAFDILTSESDPTISRPPDLDWPGDGPTGWRPAVPIEGDEFRPAVPIEHDEFRPAVPIEREDFRPAAGVFDDRETAPQAGYPPRPPDEFQVQRPGGAAVDAVDPFHPGAAPGAADPLAPGWASDTGSPRQPSFAPDAVHGEPPDVVHGEPPGEGRGTPGEDRRTAIRRADRGAGRAGGPGRSSEPCRATPVGLPAVGPANAPGWPRRAWRARFRAARTAAGARPRRWIADAGSCPAAGGGQVGGEPRR
jgi:hypothetical protein